MQPNAGLAVLKLMSTLTLLRAAALLLATTLTAAASAEAAAQWPQQETKLGEFAPFDGVPTPFVNSPIQRNAVIMTGPGAGQPPTQITLGWLETSQGCRLMEAVGGPQFLILLDGQPVPIAPKALVGAVNAQMSILGFSPNGKQSLLLEITPTDQWQYVLDKTPTKLPWPITPSAWEEMYFSPDSKHFVYTAMENGVTYVMVDGVDRTAEGIAAPQYSPDGSIEVCFKKTGGQWQAVVNGVTGAAYDEIQEAAGMPKDRFLHGAVFSDEGKHYGFIAKEGGQAFAVVDGQAGPKAAALSGLLFSKNGKHAAYILNPEENKYQVVLDGKAQAEYTNVDTLTFSADGEHLAYLASKAAPPAAPAATTGPARPPPRSTLQFAVIDGVEQPTHGRVFSLSRTPDATRFAYGVVDRNRNGLIVNGKPDPTFTRIGADFVSFSPDARHYAYPAWKANGSGGVDFFMVEDGVSQPNPGSNPPASARVYYSPDSQHQAYISGDAYLNNLSRTNTLTQTLKRPGTTAFNVVIDGKMGPAFESVAHGLQPGKTDNSTTIPAYLASGANAPVVFSLDGQHSAYQARQNGREFIVIDQVPQQSYANVVAGPVRRDDGALEYLAADTRDGQTNLYRVVVPKFSAPAK